MKKLLSKAAAFALLAVLSLTMFGCKKSKKGVLERRTYSLTGKGTPGAQQLFPDLFVCILVDGDIDLKDGEKVTFNINGTDYGNAGYTDAEYIYHENESPKSLGYKENYSDYGPFKTHYGTFENGFVASKEGYSGVPGKNSGFSRLAGGWEHEPTGLRIWIDTDNDGKALLINGGTSAPKQAVGGYAWKEINHAGGNNYKFRNQIYYPDSGWTDGSFMQLEMSDDGKSFNINGETYKKR